MVLSKQLMFSSPKEYYFSYSQHCLVAYISSSRLRPPEIPHSDASESSGIVLVWVIFKQTFC